MGLSTLSVTHSLRWMAWAVSIALPGSAVAVDLPSTPAPGKMFVGAHKVNLEPRPEEYNGYWERDYEQCANLSESLLTRQQGDQPDQFQREVDHLANAGTPWPENPNCIYQGGFGIGPMNPVTSFDTEYGIWARSIAISDGTLNGTAVLTILDAEGYLWNYAKKCKGEGEQRCGAKDLAQRFSQSTGIPSKNFVIGATHTHAGPEFLGGWGFVPDWYMRQVQDAIDEAVTGALENMQEATVEIGEERYREGNRERRDTYRSAEEQQLTWLRAYTDSGTGKTVIATMGAYAGHPTSWGNNDGIAHPDWPGTFVKEVERLQGGGVGLFFMTGLGNMTNGGGRTGGVPLARKIPPVGEGIQITDTRLKMDQSIWDHPATNVPLTALGAPGFFDREFNANPAQVRTGKSPDTAPCVSASPFSVEVAVSALRIGNQFALTTGPGELFSNLTNTIKEKSGAIVTMPLAQMNDALGYMPQDFELNMAGQQGLGFAIGGVLVVNYEDSYSIDHCFGDMALEESLRLLGELKAQLPPLQ